MDGAAVEMAAPVDLLIFCGGSSVGERDLVIDALREKGEVLFHGIAVKPGKPTAFARLGSTLVLGMPGNPTSCLSNAYVLMIPLLRALARLQPARPTVVRAPLSQRVTSPRDRLQFLPVRTRGWAGDADVQGLGRNHEPVAGGRLHHHSAGERCHRGRHAGRRHSVLTRGLSPSPHPSPRRGA